MDRISALRNVEDALRAFESGETDLAETERQVVTVLRTYATEFEDETRTVYRATGDEAVTDTVVVAESRAEARDRIRALAVGGSASATGDDERQPTDDDSLSFEVEPVG
jgi:Tfp pilus assembly protein PilX